MGLGAVEKIFPLNFLPETITVFGTEGGGKGGETIRRERSQTFENIQAMPVNWEAFGRFGEVRQESSQKEETKCGFFKRGTLAGEKDVCGLGLVG